MRRMIGVDYGFERDRISGTARKQAWQTRFQELAAATHSLGRVPKSTECEPPLRYWMATQRRNYDSLSPRRQRQLEALPGWDWDPRQARWEQRAEELRTFIAEHGKPPSTRATDAQERQLAHWYSRQRVASRSNALTGERLQLLAYAIQALPE